MSKRSSRRDDILQALVGLLQAGPEEKLTTARLAKEVGVSEAALYRHFPSKARMFEGLLEFTEDTLFSRISAIRGSDDPGDKQCADVLVLILFFAEKNPGLCRLLVGDALAGEHARLSQRVAQLFDRVEMELRQILRQAELKQGLRTRITANAAAEMLLSLAIGRLHRFQMSAYRLPPTGGWADQWQALADSLFVQQTRAS